jgi:hypothetical protein
MGSGLPTSAFHLEPYPWSTDMPDPRIHVPQPGRLTVTVVDHGAVPGGPCCAAAFHAAVAAVRSAGGGRLVVPAAVWHLRSAGPEDADAGHWTLDDLVDVEVVGHGATVVCHQVAHGIRLRRCQRVALRGLTLDWALPMASPGRVESVGDTLVLVPGPGAWAGPDVPIAGVTTWDVRTHGWAMDAAEWYHQAWGFSAGLPWTGDCWLLPERPGDLQPGMDVVVRHWIYHGNGIEFSAHRNADITLEGIEIRACPGHAFVGYGCERGIHLSGCRIARPDDPRRMVTATADGCHLGDMRGDIIIEDCDFSYQGDDSVNIHGFWLRIAAIADRALVLESRWLDRAQLAPGDQIRICARDGLATVGAAVVEACTPHASGWLVQLDRPVPAGTAIGDQVGNADRTSSRFRISRNRFHDHRARGMLIQAGDGLIDGNLVERVQMAALNLTTDCHEWQEGLGCRSVEVRGNTFRSCNAHRRERGPRGAHLACVNVLVETPTGLGREPVHQDLRFIGNRIIDTAGPGILIASARGVMVQDLRIDGAQSSPVSGCGTAIRIPGGAAVIQVGEGCTWEGLVVDGRPAEPTVVASASGSQT